MAKSKKSTKKAPVKIQDMEPAKDPKGGELSTTTLTTLANAQHEMLKGVANNLRG